MPPWPGKSGTGVSCRAGVVSSTAPKSVQENACVVGCTFVPMPYAQTGHTADLAIEVTAHTLEGLFTEAALALCDVMGARTGFFEESVACECKGVDREDLLVRWLQEILYLVEVRGFRVHGVRVLTMETCRMHAEVEGAYAGGTLATEVKAVTYHGLSIRQLDGEFSVVIILDV